MNTRIQLLAVLAVVQILVVGGFILLNDQDEVDTGPWITFESSSVTSLAVSDQDESVSLTLDDEGWMIDGLAADEEKINNLLDKLVNLEAPWPVAKTSDAIERFEVGETSFQRRLVAKENDSPVLDLVLGTSPGYQRVHARLVDEEEIYSVALSNFELPTNVDGWLDKALLTVPDEVVKVQLDDTILEKSDEGWLVNGQAADQDVATTYANRFKTMRVMGVYSGNKEVESLGTLIVNGDHKLEILREAEEGEYLIRASEIDRLFKMSTYIAEQLLMTDVDFAASSEAVES